MIFSLPPLCWGGGGGEAQKAEWWELRPVAGFVSQSSLVQAKCACAIKKTFIFTSFDVGYLLSVLSIRQVTVVVLYPSHMTKSGAIYIKVMHMSLCYVTAVKCPPLHTPVNSYSRFGLGCERRSFSTSCSFSCKRGYHIVGGSTERTCQENQKWSGTELKCQGII